MDLDAIEKYGNIAIVDVRLVEGYVIDVETADGETFRADLGDLAENERFPELADPRDFEKITPVDEGNGVGWYEVRAGLSIHWSDVVARRVGRNPETGEC